MANLTPVASNDPIPQLETSTMALGGPGAVMNSQAQALLNRMEYNKSVASDSAFNTQIGTTYTLALTDAGLTVTLGNASPITCTIPTNAVVPFRIGTNIDIIQDGAGKVTIAGSPGVTINSLAGNKSIAGQFGAVTLRKESTDTWYLFGALVA